MRKIFFYLFRVKPCARYSYGPCFCFLGVPWTLSKPSTCCMALAALSFSAFNSFSAKYCFTALAAHFSTSWGFTGCWAWSLGVYWIPSLQNLNLVGSHPLFGGGFLVLGRFQDFFVNILFHTCVRKKHTVVVEFSLGLLWASLVLSSPIEFLKAGLPLSKHLALKASQTAFLAFLKFFAAG